ncbi:hypothetical protein HPB48_019454 [Haemaphysalis longicornis]|uniref:Uncharacterized protein n=1 Tax=Haemaphysalis longicornis TaxID=44386 RepID=A0A9J6FAT9_HAELO|nr:hypothetical protein HPB48_019454 [Haemaphysalis longicornis]
MKAEKEVMVTSEARPSRPTCILGATALPSGVEKSPSQSSSHIRSFNAASQTIPPQHHTKGHSGVDPSRQAIVLGLNRSYPFFKPAQSRQDDKKSRKRWRTRNFLRNRAKTYRKIF